MPHEASSPPEQLGRHLFGRRLRLGRLRRLQTLASFRDRTVNLYYAMIVFASTLAALTADSP